jgi:hypothetical protein
VRADLSPGAQAVQACHSLRQFIADHPAIDAEWFNQSNYLALLSAKNELDLERIILECESKGIRFSVFREPDFANSITAIALEPGAKSKKLCSHLKLALSGNYGRSISQGDCVPERKQTMTEKPSGDWYCPKCRAYISDESVTNEETHQICGTSVYVIPAAPESAAAVRARLGWPLTDEQRDSNLEAALDDFLK